MSDCNTKEQCSRLEFDAAMKSGLLTREQGTNSFDLAIHNFAEMIREQYRQALLKEGE